MLRMVEGKIDRQGQKGSAAHCTAVHLGSPAHAKVDFYYSQCRTKSTLHLTFRLRDKSLKPGIRVSTQYKVSSASLPPGCWTG